MTFLNIQNKVINGQTVLKTIIDFMFFDDSKSVMCKVVSPKVDGEHALVSSTFRADRFLPIKDLNLHLLAPKRGH